uniref:Uncharacterized protein n=1 Tax=Rhodnius prolixus TaxID=13249 RepID=T1HKZ5_RHOPR
MVNYAAVLMPAVTVEVQAGHIHSLPLLLLVAPLDYLTTILLLLAVATVVRITNAVCITNKLFLKQMLRYVGNKKNAVHLANLTLKGGIAAKMVARITEVDEGDEAGFSVIDLSQRNYPANIP